MTEAVREYFEEITSADNLCVVVFTAPWCGFCHSMEKVCDAVFDKFSHIRFCRIDIEKHKGISEKYNISSVPATLVFFSGKVIRRRMGLMKKSEFYEMLRECQEMLESDSLI